MIYTYSVPVFLCEYGDDVTGDNDADMIQTDGGIITLPRARKYLTVAENSDPDDPCHFNLGVKVKSSRLTNAKFEFGEDLRVRIRIGARGDTIANIRITGEVRANSMGKLVELSKWYSLLRTFSVNPLCIVGLSKFEKSIISINLVLQPSRSDFILSQHFACRDILNRVLKCALQKLICSITAIQSLR